MRVREALAAAGSSARVIELADTARSAEDTTTSVGVALGAIVKSLVFAAEGRAVMVLVSGDQRRDTEALAAALGRRHTTGFSIAGVPPVAHATTLPMAIDAALTRFEVVYAAAGHPHCVFATSAEELARLTGAPVVEGLGI